MSGFDKRTIKGSSFEEIVAEELELLGFHVARNGSEHTLHKFVDLLRDSKDPTSLAIRFQPDGVACIGKIPRSFYWEAKNGETIEKTAWEQYIKYHKAGSVMVLIIGPGSDIHWNFIENIRLIPGEKTISSFPPRFRLPVKDGWITPRGSERWNQIREENPQACGTPYRKIDFTSLFRWKEFRHRILERLKSFVGTETSDGDIDTEETQ